MGKHEGVDGADAKALPLPGAHAGVEVVPVEGQDDEGGFVDESPLADVLVHGPFRGDDGVGVEFEALSVGVLELAEGVVDDEARSILRGDLALPVVVDEDRGSAANELHQAEGGDGERSGGGRVRDLEECDKPRHGIFVLDGEEDAEVAARGCVLDGPPPVHHVWLCWIVNDTDQGCCYSGYQGC